MSPQNAAVLRALRLRGDRGLTPVDALRDLGCFRLGARIWELIHIEGYDIRSDRLELPSGARVAVYRLVEEPVQLAAGF